MLREGMEAALIVSIIASYLKQSGQGRWMPAVLAGVVLAIVASLALGVGMNAMQAEFPQKQQELFEAAVALIAVVVLTSMVFWMRKAARHMKQQLHGSIQQVLETSRHKALALVGMAFFAVAREGLESVFFLLAAFQQDVGVAAPVGAMLGVVVSVALGLALYYGGIRLDLRRFFRWTGVFILLVAAGLLSGAVRALHEAGLWNGLQTVAYDLTRVLPSGSPLGVVLGGVLGYHDAPAIGEVLVWWVFMIPALWLFWQGTRPARLNGAA